MNCPFLAQASLAALLLVGPGCETETPTSAVVENAFPATADAGETSVNAQVIYQVWWRTTLFTAPVAPGATSEVERTVPGTDYAYALVAEGWDPESATLPTRLLALRSTDPLSVARGEILHISVGPSRFVGDCAAGMTLSEHDSDLITTRIFPGAFAGRRYDPATCTLTAAADASDAGGQD
jgi:hypothetical protein